MFNWYSFLMYVFITAYTPGPNNIMSMSNASRLGFKKSFPFNLGIWAGFSVIMLLVALFSYSLFTLLPVVKPFMQGAGALYMLFLAYKTFKSGAHIGEGEAKGSSFISGMLLQFLNPKIMIYGVTSMSAYILPHFNGWPEIIGFALMLAFIGFTSTLCWAVFGAVFCKAFSAHARILNTVMGLLLVYCAVSLFL